MLWFPPNYSDYSFGQLLVLSGCVIFRVLILLANRGDVGKKVDLEGRLVLVTFNVITNHPK